MVSIRLLLEIAPGAKEAIVHSSVVLLYVAAPEDETKLVLAGNGSCTTTFVNVVVPSFSTLSVKITELPITDVGDEALLLKETSL